MKHLTSTSIGCALCACLSSALAQESVKSRGNAFNPDTSVNILTLFQSSSSGAQSSNGISLQELELQFAADIDPYWRASAMLSVSPNANGDYGIDPEEVFAETLSIPFVTFRVGKFKAAFGKHNTLHSHAFPFVDAPLIHKVLLGDEGFNDAGVSAAALFPHLPWFSEFTLQVFAGNTRTLFASPTKDDVSANAHMKNLWDLSDDATLELGISDAWGNNRATQTTNLFGLDLTYKYKPTGASKAGMFWAGAEYINARRNGFAGPADAKSFAELNKVDGLASWIRYQFLDQWGLSARYDRSGLFNKGSFESQRREGILVSYAPSEFSEIRASYNHTTQAGSPTDNAFALQLNLSMGAHPAHSY